MIYPCKYNFCLPISHRKNSTGRHLNSHCQGRKKGMMCWPGLGVMGEQKRTGLELDWPVK